MNTPKDTLHSLTALKMHDFFVKQKKTPITRVHLRPHFARLVNKFNNKTNESFQLVSFPCYQQWLDCSNPSTKNKET